VAVKDETERVRHLYDRVADRYDTFIKFTEKLFFENGREWVCSQAQGDVLEVAIGTGRNLPYYPQDVRITGIDLSPGMLEVARERAEVLGREVALRVGDAQSLGFPDESFDTVVFTLALCTIPSERRAVAEAVRVLRPDGKLLLLEHVRSPHRSVRALQRVLEPLFVHLQADHLLREPLDYLQSAGLLVDRVERSRLGIVERAVAHKSRTADDG
jgi:ubiquinone/menaquinone biosynthesis C-methylase UbiE